MRKISLPNNHSGIQQIFGKELETENIFSLFNRSRSSGEEYENLKLNSKKRGKINMKKLTLTLCLGLLLAGCGGGDQPVANSTTKTETTTSAAETGVPACDEYLAKVEKFVNNPNVPQATRDAY